LGFSNWAVIYIYKTPTSTPHHQWTNSTLYNPLGYMLTDHVNVASKVGMFMVVHVRA
jgi:hypothetical protein